MWKGWGKPKIIQYEDVIFIHKSPNLKTFATCIMSRGPYVCVSVVKDKLNFISSFTAISLN